MCEGRVLIFIMQFGFSSSPAFLTCSIFPIDDSHLNKSGYSSCCLYASGLFCASSHRDTVIISAFVRAKRYQKATCFLCVPEPHPAPADNINSEFLLPVLHTLPCCKVAPPLQLWWWISELDLDCPTGRADGIGGARHSMSGPSTQQLVYPQMCPCTFTCRSYPVFSPKA